MKTSWILWCSLMLCLVPTSRADELDDAKTAMRQERLDAAQAALERVVAREPDHAEAGFLLAKVLSWRGQYAQALQRYAALLQREPDNMDYLFGRAQALVWSGQAGAALADIERVCERGPNDADAARLRIQALVQTRQPAARERALQLQAQAAARFPQLSWQIVQAHVPDELDRNFGSLHTSHLTWTLGHERLDHGLPSAHSQQWLLEHRFGERKVGYASVQSAERFSRHDVQSTLGAYYPLPGDGTLNAEVSASGTHQVVARDIVLASVQWPLARAWYGTWGARRSHYNSGLSRQMFGMIENYVGDFRVAYTLSRSQAHGADTSGHRLQVARYYDEASHITLTLGKSQEADAQGSRVVLTEVRTLSLHGRHWWRHDWAGQWAIGRTQSGSAYQGTSLSLALRYAF